MIWIKTQNNNLINLDKVIMIYCQKSFNHKSYTVVGEIGRDRYELIALCKTREQGDRIVDLIKHHIQKIAKAKSLGQYANPVYVVENE